MSETAKDFKLQSWLEFKERRGFFGWIAVAVTMFAFCAARIGLVAEAGRKSILPPGEYYTHRNKSATLVVHVLSITAWSILGVIQFVPHVRKVAIGYHRWAGRFYFLCSVALVVSGLILMPTAFGGSTCAVAGTVVLAVLFIGSAGVGFTRIRQRRIEEHRSWMLRNFAIGSSVIWIRLVIVIGIAALRLFDVWEIIECPQVLFELGGDRDEMLELFPLCATEERVIVSPSGPTEINVIAASRLSYGLGLWLGLIINMIAVELWIRRQQPEKAQAPMPQVEEAPGVSATAWGS